MCEKISVSEFSPGPVKDNEILLSVVTSRHFVSPNGRVAPTLFDRRMSNGISTDRKKHTTLTDYDSRAAKLVARHPGKSNCGSIALSVKEIRAIHHGGARAVAVYDTALSGHESHAEIACTEVPPAETPDRKKIRAILRKKVLDAVLKDGQVLDASELFR